MIPTEEKIKIGYDVHQEQRYNNQKEAKIRAFDELLEYVKEYIKESEIDFNTNNLKSEIINKILGVYKSQFPKIVSDEKVLELIGFVNSKLSALVDRFESIDIEFNTKTKQTKAIDFTIYAQNNVQAEKYIQFKRLADELNVNQNYMFPGLVMKQQLCEIINKVVFFNYSKDCFEPNLEYILKQ